MSIAATLTFALCLWLFWGVPAATLALALPLFALGWIFGGVVVRMAEQKWGM